MSVHDGCGDRAEARALHEDAGEALDRNEPEKALDLLRKCLVRARAGGDGGQCAAVLFEMGFILTSLARYDEAADAYGECLPYWERPPVRPELAAVLTRLAQVQRFRGDESAAADACRRLRDVCRALGDLRGEGLAVKMLGQILFDPQAPEAGLTLMIRGLELLRSAAPDEAELMVDHVRFQARAEVGEAEFRRVAAAATSDTALLAALLG
jgi:tetratricopeptide (TPR) repeat protein